MGLLGVVWVVRPCIDFELEPHSSPEPIFRKHAIDSMLDDFCWIMRQKIGNFFESGSPWVPGVAEILLLLSAFSFENDLLCVDDNDVITAVNVRGKQWLVLTANECSNA